MKKLSNICAVSLVSLALTGCGIYEKYESKAQIPTDAYGTTVDITEATNGNSIAEMSWREFFTDPLLQELIEQVLANNTDLNSARIAVEKSEASLKAARMAYLPSLYFSPQGTLAKFDDNPWSKTYNLPLQMSVDLDVFGSITSKKRASKAVLMQSKLREEALRANLISTTAQQYYMLQLLDRQLEIMTATDSLWNASLETQKTLWENGKSYSTAVNQMESSYLNIKTQIVDNRRNIRSVENAICRLIGITPQHIKRNKWGSSELPHHPESETTTGQRMFDTRFLKIGVPAALLQNRPDVRMADYVMAEAFYNTQSARAAFYPSLTLQGVAGWTNSAGGAVIDPGKLLLNAVASLTQPIFARGRLLANLKIAKLTEEDLQRKYVQTVIDAGNQVNEAMADCQAAREKHAYYHRQVSVLQDAYQGTHELMDNGKANYLEVLTAQESLLNSQLSEAMNMYHGAQAIIALYIALGGGSK
ncbi:MAG: TolC family protein [Bacteroidaceae bacterium]|nr:TolC family protein [Bacteroidaceae bacterium]